MREFYFETNGKIVERYKINILLVVRFFSVAFLIMFSAPAQAYIYGITVLERDDQTIILLADAHNVGSIEQVREQGKLLSGLLKRLNRNSPGKARYLYEDPVSFSFEDNTMTFSNWRDFGSGCCADLNVETGWCIVTRPETGGFGLAKVTAVSTTPVKWIEKISTIDFVKSDFGNLTHIYKRSFDPRYPLIENCPKELKNGAIYQGSLFSTRIILEDRRSSLNPNDLQYISDLLKRFEDSPEFANWLRQAENEAPELNEKLLQSKLIHYIDLGAIIDLLSHNDQPVKILFAGGSHIQFIESELIKTFEFKRKENFGGDFNWLLEWDKSLLTRRPITWKLEGGRVMTNDFALIVEPVNSYLEYADFHRK